MPFHDSECALTKMMGVCGQRHEGTFCKFEYVSLRDIDKTVKFHLTVFSVIAVGSVGDSIFSLQTKKNDQ